MENNQANPFAAAAPDIPRRSAIWFVILLGLVSLFADATYESARSIVGPYLAVLGASGAVVGVAAGAGELVGYGVRLFSGALTDRSRRYWSITIIGYAVNLAAVPLLALAGNWPIAVGLMIAERTGKAIRTPARDAMLSHATHATGRGWGFGLHEAMDQLGAMAGPLALTVVVGSEQGYRTGFALLAIPATLCLLVLAAARFLYPNPLALEVTKTEIAAAKFPRVYWIYLVAAGLIAFGYVDFPLIAYHFEKADVVPDVYIPVFYSVAMASAAVSALVFGRLFDRIGLWANLMATILGSLFALPVFYGGFAFALLGMILWGVGMGAQESILRAFVAEIVAPERRGRAYGLFGAVYGVAWFAGSALMGVLYDHALSALIVVSAASQLAAALVILTIRTKGGVTLRH
ncbi:MFS transporter [Methylocapsa polymorpha]|uniref:MFS transporter n=1 Tax=Methylocapsa polymorpha TaxID=3080828 RepID=A0ABZ0HV48_9HYPH|nr:MFS transporter [Methylocapsa sp. RX1]